MKIGWRERLLLVSEDVQDTIFACCYTFTNRIPSIRERRINSAIPFDEMMRRLNIEVSESPSEPNSSAQR